MSFLDGIVRLGGEKGVAPGFLRPIDTERIAKELRLEERAAEFGETELPSSDATVLDAAEQTVVQKLEGEWTWQSGELINLLRSYAARLTTFSVDTEFNKLKIQANNALTTLRSLDHRAPAELGPLKESFLDVHREFGAFRRKHRLVRPPRSPSNRWTVFGLLFVLIAFEAVFNGVFFAEGHTQGLIGGIGTAVGISIVNVFAAFLLGLFPARWVSHRNVVIKLVGLVIAVAGSVFLLAFHGFAAHLRDANVLLSAGGNQVTSQDALRAALVSIIERPLQLTDMMSYYLFLLGGLFAGLAMWKGYRFDDPYPGYGAISRRLIDAREAYSDRHAELFEDLEDVKEVTIRDVRAGIDRIPRFPQEAANIRVQRSAVVETFRTYEKSVVTACNQLLAHYRQRNSVSRKTRPPTYFNNEWQLSGSVLDSDDVRMLLTEAVQEPSQITAMLNELHQHSETLLAEYEKLMASFPHPSQMV